MKKVRVAPIMLPFLSPSWKGTPAAAARSPFPVQSSQTPAWTSRIPSGPNSRTEAIRSPFMVTDFIRVDSLSCAPASSSMAYSWNKA